MWTSTRRSVARRDGTWPARRAFPLRPDLRGSSRRCRRAAAGGAEEALIGGVVRGSGSARRRQAARPAAESSPRRRSRLVQEAADPSERDGAAADRPCRRSTVHSELVGQASPTPEPAIRETRREAMRRDGPDALDRRRRRGLQSATRPNASSRRFSVGASRPSAPLRRDRTSRPSTTTRSAGAVPAQRRAGVGGRSGRAVSAAVLGHDDHSRSKLLWVVKGLFRRRSGKPVMGHSGEGRLLSGHVLSRIGGVAGRQIVRRTAGVGAFVGQTRHSESWRYARGRCRTRRSGRGACRHVGGCQRGCRVDARAGCADASSPARRALIAASARSRAPSLVRRLLT